MLIQENYEMTMIRGDSEKFTVEVTDEDDISMLKSGATVYFTVKYSTRSDNNLIQKIVKSFPNNEAIIEIDPFDTKHLDYGTYVYDIQFTSNTGYVKTLVSARAFTIGGEVTHE